MEPNEGSELTKARRAEIGKIVQVALASECLKLFSEQAPAMAAACGKTDKCSRDNETVKWLGFDDCGGRPTTLQGWLENSDTRGVYNEGKVARQKARKTVLNARAAAGKVESVEENVDSEAESEAESDSDSGD